MANAGGDNLIPCPEWLQGCESPFIWHASQVKGLGSDQNIQRALQSLDGLQFEGPEFSLYKVETLLKLVLHYYLQSCEEAGTVNDVSKSWEYMNEIEDLLRKENKGSDEFFKQVKSAVEHVTLTTKAHLLALNNEQEKSKEISKDINPVNEMSNREQAAILGMKATMILHSDYESGRYIAANVARKAVEIDPDCPDWKFYLALALRNIRREKPHEIQIPSKEEIDLLESAAEKSNMPKHLVYLGHVYSECATQAVRQYRNRRDFKTSELKSTIRKMNEEAIKYFKKALAMKPDSPSIMRRIGYGIMNLPREVKQEEDNKLTLDCLLRSVELSRNQITMQILGTYYHRCVKDLEEAVKWFKEAAEMKSHNGLKDMVRVKFELARIKEQEYNPINDLETGLSWENRNRRKTELLVQIGGYYLFIKEDFRQSLTYFSQILENDPHYEGDFKSLFLRMQDPVNLYKCLINEALLFLQNKPKHTDASEDVGCEISSLLDKLEARSNGNEMIKQLLRGKPDPLFVSNLLKRSEELIQQDKEREREKTQNSNWKNSTRMYNGNSSNWRYRNQNKNMDNWRQKKGHESTQWKE